MNRFDHYLNLVKRLQKRYSKNGCIVLRTGFKLSRYSELSNLAYRKYILQEVI